MGIRRSVMSLWTFHTCDSLTTISDEVQTERLAKLRRVASHHPDVYGFCSNSLLSFSDVVWRFFPEKNLLGRSAFFIVVFDVSLFLIQFKIILL